ncbi:LytTR family DNA-binding domain-containing protein [Algoriphagus halophytocola]|uniref:LytTR family DNA-binding domain-containing protein n=1 Tax=Algoriphagus halophytocola TaxID=2991499 RepID=A0ABY6MG71_9BACT|nr:MULTISPECIES: LytTR family DNA-binding domain-containing protein [unclassified Algoriphagus]UZD22787.1 LytTR family DNA-binding domain-containing protein [Algoriphagus sp. TR-M5]WBL44053.1 LytTR family DNA-binding domain-containing protein [Algoriphagus sp. TR-M9]
MNCLIVDDEPIAQNILKEFISKVDYLHLTACCSNASEAFNSIQKEDIDLVFLDINMPGIDGISFAKIIPKKVQVIFTTAYREYALEGFELEATDYLLKPIPFERFLKAVSKTKQSIAQNEKPNVSEKPEFLFVRQDRKMEKIAFDEILYVESYSDYLKIHLKTQTILARESLSNFAEKLPENQFIRIHRSFIANLSAITSYTHEFVEVNGNALTISRSFKEDVLKRLQQFE